MLLVGPKSIQPVDILAGCIAIYENVWPDYEETIKQIEEESKDPALSAGFVRAKTTNQINGRTEKSTARTNSDFSLSSAAHENEFFRKLNNRFYDLVTSAVSSYQEKMLINESLYHVEPYNILKYQTGQEYIAHYDGATGTGRAVSPILYLNNDYTGGELEFVHFGIKIKPAAGSLFVFPSNYPYAHIAHPVQEGTKYAIVTWLHDRQDGSIRLQ